LALTWTKQITCRRTHLYDSRLPSYSGTVPRSVLAWCIGFAAVLAVGCSNQKSYPLVGQVISVDPERQELTIRHEDIRGFMPGMTMPFKVKDPAQVAAARPGDLITATLIVDEQTGYLDDVKKTGEAALPADIPKRPVGPLIDPGAEVPDAAFVDQNGRERNLSDWRGKTTVVTFIYTRCPLPDFCPLMDRNFAAVQAALKEDPALAGRVHLVSVSFDPDHDTPPVLKKHAARVGADPALWSFVTGSREAIDKFGAGFGVNIMREDGTMEEIIHNLRTAVIDPNGRLVHVLNGNDWKPERLLSDIRAVDARR
jgi:protein SCO1/2